VGLLRLSARCLAFSGRNTDALGEQILAVPLSRAKLLRANQVPARSNQSQKEILEWVAHWLHLHGATVALEGVFFWQVLNLVSGQKSRHGT
jgi:hypothetical protein